MRATVTAVTLIAVLAAAGCSVSGTTPPPPPDTMSQILASILPTANQAVGCALADSANSDAEQDLTTMTTDASGGQAPVPFTAAGDLTKALGELTQAQADAKDSPNGLGDDVGWLKVTLQELLATVQAAPEGGDIPADSMDWAGYAQHTGYVVADCKAFGYGFTSVPFTVSGS